MKAWWTLPFLLLTGASVEAAVSAPVAAQTETTLPDSIVTTRHRVTVGGRVLAYTARAGLIPIRDNEAGDVRAHIFFVSYTLDRDPAAPPRPLTFVWNGGPGSSGSQPHLLGFGPRRVRTGDDFATSPPFSETELEDNQETWLTATDLVFVDPVGTGYSRPTKREFAADFYQTRGDAESVAEFIRVYLVRFDAMDAPLFIAGESYGTIRDAHVADVLARRGIPLRGAILAALAIPLGQRPPAERAALAVPSYTAAAFYHKKLEPELLANLGETLRRAESWAMNEYAPALARRDALGDSARAAVAAQLVRYTGVDTGAIDRKTLAIEMGQFADHLLRNERRVLGRYDSRLTAPASSDTTPRPFDPTVDASLAPQLKHMNGTSVLLLRYLRRDLKYRSDLLYQGPFGGGYPPPTTFRGDWMSTRWDRGSAENRTAATSASLSSSAEQPLRRALLANPSLRLLVTCGTYDLVCSYYENEWALQQLEPALASRITVRTYAGGHEAYLNKPARAAMQRDLATFIRETLKRR